MVAGHKLGVGAMLGTEWWGPQVVLDVVLIVF